MNMLFEVNGTPTIDLDSVLGKVILIEGGSNTVEVLVTGPEDIVSEFRLQQEGSTIKIKGPRKGVSMVSIGDGDNIVVTGSICGSLSVAGGRVIINGVDVTAAAKSGKTAKQPPLEARVTVPRGTNLIVGSVRALVSNFFLGAVELDISGQSEVHLSEVSQVSGSVSGQSRIEIEKFSSQSEIKLKVSGQSEADISSFDGNPLDLEASGQSEITAAGNAATARVAASGQSTVKTKGDVAGDYTANAAGMSEIKHRGPIHGSKRERSSGMSEIDLSD